MKEYNDPIIHKRLAKLRIYFCKHLILSGVLIGFNYRGLVLRYFTEMHIDDMPFYE